MNKWELIETNDSKLKFTVTEYYEHWMSESTIVSILLTNNCWCVCAC